MVIFGIHGHAEIIRHLLERKDVCHGVIIYIYDHREDIHGAPHDVFRVTSITVNPEVSFRWTHIEV